jgi:BTB/POZ domain-containing protein KCTD9
VKRSLWTLPWVTGATVTPRLLYFTPDRGEGKWDLKLGVLLKFGDGPAQLGASVKPSAAWRWHAEQQMNCPTLRVGPLSWGISRLSHMPDRASYIESCRVLQRNELLENDELPPLPDRPPRHDEQQLGVSFFRTRLADVALDSLTLPRTFFGRSEIRSVSFRGSDLSQSTANWNDFIDVDFNAADLSHVDFRASIFERISFRGAVLRGADLRRTTFRGCTFDDADMAGARLTPGFRWLFRLSRRQRAVIDWQPPGPEPEGG